MKFNRPLIAKLVLILIIMAVPQIGFADTQYEPRTDNTEKMIKDVPSNLSKSVVSGLKVVPEAAKDAIKVEQKEENKFLGITKSVSEFFYSTFDRMGSWFDQLGTGDKPIKGSLKGEVDPLPVTEHERKF